MYIDEYGLHFFAPWFPLSTTSQLFARTELGAFQAIEDCHGSLLL